MKHHLHACDLMEAAGHTTVPIPISEVRAMAARIGKAKIKTTNGKTMVEPVRAYDASKARRIVTSKAKRVVSPAKAAAARGT